MGGAKLSEKSLNELASSRCRGAGGDRYVAWGVTFVGSSKVLMSAFCVIEFLMVKCNDPSLSCVSVTFDL